MTHQKYICNQPFIASLPSIQLAHLLAVCHHEHLEAVAVCPDELEHGVTADIPDHQGAQAAGGGDDVTEPERVHAEQRGPRQLQVLQRCAILLDALKNTEREINLIIA